MTLKRYAILIFLIIILIAFGVIFFSLRTNDEVHKAVTNEFVNNIAKVSKSSVIAIKNDIDSIKRTLIFLREGAVNHKLDFKNENLTSHILSIYKSIDFMSVNDIGFIDKNGILIYNISAPDIIGMDFSFRQYFKNVKQNNDPSFMDVQSIEFKGANRGDRGILFSIGIFTGGDDPSKNSFEGIVVITSTLYSFVQKYIKPLPIGYGGYSWLFDSTGTVLHHPSIPTGKTLDEINNEEQYTSSFKNAIKKVISDSSSTGEYIEDGKSFIYATNSIQIGNEKWHFLVSVQEQEIHELLGHYSMNYALTAISVLALILFGAAILYILYIRNQALLQDIDQKTFQLKYEKKINEELDDFIHSVAHDLKAPLSSVMGFSELVLEKALGNKLDENDTQNLSRIYVNANLMQELIENLLEFARIGKTNSIIEDVSIRSVIKEVRLQLNYIIEKRGAEINFPNDMPVIRVDRMKITQLFSNLINNAIKFVPADKKPVVDVTCEEDDKFYNISVTDNGIGIDESDMSGIFKIFHRLKNIDVEGSGVGLAIVKKIVEEHHGKIAVKSQKSVGTTFTVSFRK